ncbi:poly [ADP-ribose] polymerase [Cydia splendana]|uniref:poly [ADP-ribose] polymerase n=1 Tax=Cydia splendana TaxID=1100963 RepID=UPI00300D8834
MAELPYQAEYAKSGRAGCKGCKQKIEQGTLRIAVMVQSAFHDSKQPNWHHEECFFRKQRPKIASDIGNLNKLRHGDQKRIKEAIENLTGIVMPVEKGKGKGKGKKRANGDASAAASLAALKDFFIEYSKSSRATCKHCDIKICKDEVRISKTVYDTEIGQKYGGQPLWHHVKCFAEARGELLYMAGGEDLPGFNNLKKDDQKMVKEAIKPLKGEEVPIKKLKAEPKDEKELEEEKELEKKLAAQNKLFFKYRDALQDYSKRDIQDILEANNQKVVPGNNECRDLLADIMAFGALEPCPECKGQLVLDTFGYKCTGDVSEWTKCSYVTKEPNRKPMKVPAAFKDGGAFKRFKPKKGVRLFENGAPPPQIIVKKEEPQDEIKKNIPIPPLKNLQFFIYGRLKTDKEKLKHHILKLGGLVTSKITDTLAAVVSSKGELEKMNSKMEEVQRADIEVVEPSFFDLIDPEKGSITKTLELIKEHNIADWGSDPAKRVPQDVIDGKSIHKSGSMYKSTKSAPTKLKLKGGTAVDPDSGLEDVAHVYRDDMGTKYTVVLGKTDVVAQKNSYYKMQVLEADDRKKYWFFRAWGRIGTTIGSNKLEDCRSADEAIMKFEELFEEKTENYWDPNRKHIRKVPGAYYPVEVDYEEEESKAAPLHTDTACKLPMPVQKLITHIFDISVMKKTLLEFELDTEKMPLGKLSKKQVKAGYKVLSELLGLLNKGEASQNKIIDATNRFYTLVPHNFGVNNPPLLDNVEAIKAKTEMLDNLLEIEIAYSLLKSDANETTSPIESHYLKLKAEIAPVDKGSPEFQLIATYTANTHAATHSNYTLEIQEVFKVVREGEDKRYKPFRKLHNRRLLWHGSRVTNFAGILSQGLRIAPPEAPVTGYMFGKGIYFADMVSKSANYCCTSKNSPLGVMLLAEVALGNMKECTAATYIEKLPAATHSTWGQGRTQPDPAMNKTLDCGTVVPLGKPQTRDINTSLLYNEFIVYDVAQVNVKYLLQMKFNYKY